MEPNSSSEHVKQLFGWTFKQWAHAAAWTFARQYPTPQPTMDALQRLQIVWRTHHATHDEPPLTGLMPMQFYEWAWTCAAIFHAAEECKRLGMYRLDRK